MADHVGPGRAGVSQYRLAQLSGVTKQTVSKLELDETSPSWETVQLLAKALGVSCEAFVTDDVQPPEPLEFQRVKVRPRGTPDTQSRPVHGTAVHLVSEHLVSVV